MISDTLLLPLPDQSVAVRNSNLDLDSHWAGVGQLEKWELHLWEDKAPVVEGTLQQGEEVHLVEDPYCTYHQSLYLNFQVAQGQWTVRVEVLG